MKITILAPAMQTDISVDKDGKHCSYSCKYNECEYCALFKRKDGQGIALRYDESRGMRLRCKPCKDAEVK